MTETGAAACVMANREPRHVGTSCFGRAGRLRRDPRSSTTTGSDAGVDAPGELLVRAAGADPRRDFFSGYLKDEAATEEAWAGGWFHTGDIVRRDADGNFYFVDRKKNVIRRSGENISAVEVESVLNQHPAVSRGASPRRPIRCAATRCSPASCCARPSMPPQRAQIAASIVAHALAQLAYYKAPGYVAFVDALPLTASQKIQRGELRELAHGAAGAGPLHRHARDEEEAGHDARRAAHVLRRRRGRRAGDRALRALLDAQRALVHRPGRSRRWCRPAACRRSRSTACAVSSFSLAPDTAVGVTQHLGLSPRWLDHIPTGGASGVMALRRAARAVQAGDADIVACIAADTNHVDSFRQTLGSFSNFARDASYPYGSGGPNSIFAFITANYMRTYGATREDFGRIASPSAPMR